MMEILEKIVLKKIEIYLLEIQSWLKVAQVQIVYFVRERSKMANKKHSASKKIKVRLG